MAPKGEIKEDMDTETRMNILVCRLKMLYGGPEAVRRSDNLPSSFLASLDASNEDVVLVSCIDGGGTACSAAAASFSMAVLIYGGGRK